MTGAVGVDDDGAVQRWRPEGWAIRPLAMFLVPAGPAYAVLSEPGGADRWDVGFLLATVVVAVVLTVLGRRERVDALDEGLHVVRPPFTDRLLAWHDIVDIRREPPHATRLAAQLRDGELVDLRVSIDHRNAVVERWRLETG